MKTVLFARFSWLMMLLLGFSLTSMAQQTESKYNVYFKKGTFVLEENLQEMKSLPVIKYNEQFAGRFYRFIQFYEIPSREERIRLDELDIQLLEYIPKNVYVASLPSDIKLDDLKSLNIRSLQEIPADHKKDARLDKRPFPEWVMKGDQIRVLIQCYTDIELMSIKLQLSQLGYQVLESLDHAHAMIVLLEPTSINTLAQQPFVRYLDFESQPGEPESDDGRNLHRSNAIDADYFGGYQYDGTGVSVAINDDGYAGPHIDFKGRADQTDVANDFTGDHGDMTVGIVGAAGNLNPIMRGMAPGAFLWVRAYYSSLPNTVTLHQNEDVMVFSSSYSNGCNAGYTSTTQLVDGEIYDNPSLIQVFSAGNSNNNDCGYGAGTQWGNITGGHKMGKNVIATANLYNDNSLVSSSSRGPASDGRVKPDIAAHGQGHWSTDPNNSYAAGGGTSAAAPGIAGVLAQLHHAYRDLNNGNDAPSALLKASLLNTATDLGNTGPDFKFGWGKVNALKAYKTLEEGRYIADSVSNNMLDQHTLAVPTGVKEMRVMIYWHDVEASTSAAYALVNDLNMTITDLSSTVHYPLILDHTPNATTLNNPATPGVDSINNVEQIRISNPAAGNYTVRVVGTSVPQGPQGYYLVYEYLYDEIELIYPQGGEGLVPGSSERIHWDAHGTSGTFTAEYSLNGTTWTTLSSSIPGSSRFYSFTVPNVVSKAKIRISRNGISDESDAFFSIINTPTNIQVSSVCSGTNTVTVVWDSVPGANSYDVFYLGDMYMDSVGSTNGFSHTFTVQNITQDHWVSVRACNTSDVVGRRAIAVKADGSGCFLDCISDDDAGIDSILSPQVMNESCAGSTLNVSVNLSNIGPNNQTNFPVYYQLDNQTAVMDTFTGNLAGGAIEYFEFSQNLSLTTEGLHNLKVWTGLSNDGAHCNDTLELSFHYYSPIVSFPYVEDFQSGIFPPQTMSIINPDGGDTWTSALVTGSNGQQTSVAYMNNYSYNNQGGEDHLSVVSMDLDGTNYAMLSFDVAYSPYSSTYSDGLRIDISTNCGQTYTQVYNKSGTTLSTTSGYTTSVFVPSSANDWRRDSVDLSAYTGNDVKIRFANINGWGNNLYLDNIEVANTSLESYCIPVSNCSVGDEIDNFSLNTINQVGTGCGTNGYSNYLSYTTNLEKGADYLVSLSTNYSNQYASIWIDLNNDSIFNNTNERVLFDMHLANTGTLYSDTISIPVTASQGAHRMRVRVRWNASCNDPCLDFTYGETHDYTVFIIDPVPVVDLGPDLVLCEGSSALLSAQVSSGTPPYSYLWSTGDLTSSISVAPTTITSYSLTVTDANQTTASDLILVTVSSLPVADLGPDQIIIQGNSVTLDPGSGFSSYYWNTGDTSSTLTVSSGGSYEVTVSDMYGCEGSDVVLITVLPNAGPNWSSGITSSNHTILIPNFANITVNGDPVQIGDYMGVFYDSLGTLVCAGYTMWDGNITSITAWGSDGNYEGFDAGEEFKWKIWQASSQLEFSAVASYSTTFPNQEFFTANGMSGIDSLASISPNWNYSVTSSNHTILIPNFANISVNGNPAQSGDYLGVFYDSLGTLVCAGYTIWDGSTTSITAWGSDGNYEGFDSGEAFKWKIWQASSQHEYTAIASYSNLFPNQEFYASNGMSGIDSLATYAPDWNFTITSSNHTILIPEYANIMIDGSSIQTGDYLGVFYDSLGTQVCAGYTVWDGSTTSITAWGSDGNYEGFAAGEEFQWKIWKISNQVVYDATASYSNSFPNQQYYASNGISGIDALTASLNQNQIQTISFEQGWGIFSTYIEPINPDISDIMDTISNYLVIIKNGSGDVYWPQWGVDLIGDLVLGAGYQYKMNIALNLDIEGSAAVPEITPLILPDGWSIIGYLRQSPASAEACMSDIVSNMVIMKSGDGSIYWPLFGLNTIVNLIPGLGYQIKTSAPDTLYYPANNANVGAANKSFHSKQRNPLNTGTNMTLGLITQGLTIGDEIWVYSEDNRLVGSAIIHPFKTAVTIWGDDAISGEKDGLAVGESYRLVLASDGSELMINKWIQGDEYFEKDKIAIAELSANGQALSDQFILYQNTPNPFSEETEIHFYTPETCELSLMIYNVLGEVVMQKGKTNQQNYYEKGDHKLTIPGDQLPQGTYYYRVISSTFDETRKMIKLK